MKLDKIKFAQLIGYIYSLLPENHPNVETLDELIDINVEPVALPINLSSVDGLMQCMAEGTRKIEAIKYYRSLTGLGLKESKEAVEKYWRADDVKISKSQMIDKLNGNPLQSADYAAVKSFINNL